MVKNRVNKSAQMMIWVIFAIAIVIIVLVFFLLRENVLKPTTTNENREDISLFIEDCTKLNVENAIDILLPNGGFIQPEHSKLYNGINVSYLCYNSGNYYPCINEHPLYMNELKKEIKEYIEPKITQCFDDYKTEMERRGVIVNFKEMNTKVELAPDRIFIDLTREVSVEINEQIETYDEFKVEVSSPVYNLARIAMEIASQEAKYCYFEYVGYMILYPKFKIEKESLSDYTEIYSIEDKKSKEKLNIAVRSCAIPPGF